MKIRVEFPRRFGSQGANRMAPLRSQRGLVLMFTLIILIAMTLAGIALVRSVDTSTMIAGNLAFRQSAEASGALAIEQAAGWIGQSLNAVLEGPPAPGNGYYPSRSTWDLTGNRTPADGTDDAPWGTAPRVPLAGTDAAGNVAYYFIHRQCNIQGTLNPNTCSVVASNTSVGQSYGSLIRELPYKADMTSQTYKGYYMVTVKVIGPRNTVSYTQAILTNTP